MSHYVELGNVYAKLLQEQNPIRRCRVVPTGQVGNWTLSIGHKLLSVHWHLHSPSTNVSLYPRAHLGVICRRTRLHLLQSVPVVCINYCVTVGQ